MEKSSGLVHECLLIAAGGEKALCRLLEITKLNEDKLMDQLALALSKRSSRSSKFFFRVSIPYEKLLALAAQDIMLTYH